MSLPKLIGILGKKRSGKDTLGNYLKEKYKYECYAFAKPLKDAAKTLFLLTDEQLYGDIKEVKDNRWNMSPREILQFIGTIFRGLTDGKFWLIHFYYYFQQNKSKNIVVTDCRYQNEVDIIKKLGGIVVKIDRNIDSKDNHISETEIDSIKNYDYCIENAYTLDKYYENIDRTIEKIKIKQAIEIMMSNQPKVSLTSESYSRKSDK